MGGGSKVQAASSSAADTISISISSPSDGSTVNAPVTVSAQASGTSSITDMQLALDGTVVAETHSNSIQASVSPSPGAHQLTVHATDAAGMRGQKSVNFKVGGGTAASLQIQWPPDQAVLPSPMHVSASVSGTQNNLTLMVDGKQVATGAGKLETDVAMAIGAHAITVSGQDANGGNVQQTVQVSVPAPRYALVMNDDRTVSSYLFDVANSQLRAQDYTLLSGTPQSLAVGADAADAGFSGALIRPTSNTLLAYRLFDGLATSIAVQENSSSPQLSVAAVSSPGTQFFYESAAGGASIRGFACTQGGVENVPQTVMTELANSPYAVSGQASTPVASAMAFTRDGRFGYLANPASNSVERFAIATSGDLTSLGLLPAGIPAEFTQMDPTGRFLLVSSSQSTRLAILKVNRQDGSLAAVPGSPFQVSQNPNPKIASSGLYLFVTEDGGSAITTYRMNAVTGALTALQTTAVADNVLGADPSGKFLLSAEQINAPEAAQNIIHVFAIAADGTLTLRSAARTRGSAMPTSIYVGAGKTPVQWTPSLAYMALASADNTSAGQVAEFAISPIHGLPSFDGQARSFPAQQPAALAKGWLVAAQTMADAGGNATVWFPYSASNGLSVNEPDPRTFAVSGTQHAPMVYARSCTQCGSGAWDVTYDGQSAGYSLTGLSSLTADPLGEFLFGTALINGLAYNRSFSIDPATGAPKLLQLSHWTWDASVTTVTNAGGTVMFSVDPNGWNIEVSYRILNSGVMHPMSNSYFNGTKMVVHPSGHYAIAVNAIGPLDAEGASGQISVYEIDDLFAQMTLVAGPYSTPRSARDIAIDDSGKFVYVANGGAVSVFTFNAKDGTLHEVPFSPVQVGNSNQLVTAVQIMSTHQ